MHHTEDRKDAVDESRRLVDDPNVHLTVDVLIRAGKLHGRKVKRKAWKEVGLFIALSYPSYVHRVIIYSSNTIRLTHNQFHLSNTANDFIIKSLTIVTYTFFLFLPFLLVHTWNDINNCECECSYEYHHISYI